MFQRFFFAAAFTFMSYANCVICRHDIAEEKYILFAKENQFTPVGHVFCHHLGSSGTLISPRTVLVSAHAIKDRCLATFKIYDPRKKKEIEIKGRAISHPQYYQKSNSDNKIISLHNDVGLIILERPVKHIKPAKFWTGPVKQGEMCFCAGYGKRGNGLTGPQKIDFTKRAFTNTFAGVFTDKLFGTSYAIIFHPPQDRSQVTYLEGIGAEGDSGAPVFVYDKESDRYLIAGILNLLVRKGHYHSYNTILPINSVLEWIEKNKR